MKELDVIFTTQSYEETHMPPYNDKFLVNKQLFRSTVEEIVLIMPLAAQFNTKFSPDKITYEFYANIRLENCPVVLALLFNSKVFAVFMNTKLEFTKLAIVAMFPVKLVKLQFIMNDYVGWTAFYIMIQPLTLVRLLSQLTAVAFM